MMAGKELIIPGKLPGSGLVIVLHTEGVWSWVGLTVEC